MKKKILFCVFTVITAACFFACENSGTQEQEGAIIGDREEVIVLDEDYSENNQGLPGEAEGNLTEASAGNEESENGSGQLSAESDQTIFRRFLNNEISAKFSESFQNDLSIVCYEYSPGTEGEETYTFSGKESLTYEDLKNAVDATLYPEPSGEERYYAICSTIGTGEVLAVKFQNLGLYSPEDTSYAVFFFAVRDGELYMTYAYDSWDRNFTEISEHFVLSGYGSSGAGDVESWMGYIDETGHYKEIYTMRTLYDDWVAMYDYDDFGMNSDWSWSQGSVFYLLDTQDGSYYCYEASDTVDTEKLDVFISFLEGKGMRRLDVDGKLEDAVGEIINAAYEKHGVASGEFVPFDGWIALD